MREVGLHVERPHDRVRRDRVLELGLIDVQRGHRVRGGDERGADARGVLGGEAGHLHLLDGHERGVAQPELEPRGEHEAGGQDHEHAAAHPRRKEAQGQDPQRERAQVGEAGTTTSGAAASAASLAAGALPGWAPAGDRPAHAGSLSPSEAPPVQSGEVSTSPRNCTSGSSSTPKRSRTRRRPSPISAITSAVVASPMFSTKFACFSEKRAPPTVSPRQPASSSSTPALRPSARGSSGFLKVEPKVLMPDGCAALREARMSASVAFTDSGSASLSANEARATISLSDEVRAAVAEAELVGSPALGAARGRDLHPLEHAREVAAVGVRVHLHGAADRAGDVHAELEPAEPGPGGEGRGLRKPRAAAAEQARPVLLDRCKRAVQLHDKSSEPFIRYEKVRAGPHHSYPDALRCRPGQQLGEGLGRIGPREEVPVTAGPDRREAGQRVVGLDAGRSAHATSLRASSSTSPAPSVSSRSPSLSSLCETLLGVLQAGHPPDRAPRGRVRRRLRDEEAAHVWEVLGPLPRPVDVQHDYEIRQRERAAEVAGEHLRARVEMRLERGDQAVRLERPRGLERGAHLGGVMGVVVVHERAAASAAVLLEAASGARELREAGRGFLNGHARSAHRRQCGESIEDVVLAGYLEVHFDPIHHEPRAAGSEGQVLRVARCRSDTASPVARQLHAWPQHPHGRRLRELLERLLELPQIRVGGVMVELHVGHHRHVTRELQERAV